MTSSKCTFLLPYSLFVYISSSIPYVLLCVIYAAVSLDPRWTSPILYPYYSSPSVCTLALISSMCVLLPL